MHRLKISKFILKFIFSGAKPRLPGPASKPDIAIISVSFSSALEPVRSVGGGGSRSILGGIIYELGARMCLENTATLVAWPPLLMNARRHGWSDERVVTDSRRSSQVVAGSYRLS